MGGRGERQSKQCSILETKLVVPFGFWIEEVSDGAL
jgi:hypothetical protein